MSLPPAMRAVIGAADADVYGDVLDDGSEPAPIQVITGWAAKGNGRMRSYDADFYGLIHAEHMRRDNREEFL